MTIDLSAISTAEKQNWLNSAVAPRPIALASTISKNGEVNLSPFSFFNVFSSNPPIVILAPNRRVRNGTRKHTIMNLEEVPEVAISIVDLSILEKVNQSSAEYARGVNEFHEVGLTEVPSQSIRPPFVKESRISMECRVIELKSLGDNAGAGTLVIAEVNLMHVDDGLLDQNGVIDPERFQQVARLGQDWYTHTDPSVLFKLPKPSIQF